VLSAVPAAPDITQPLPIGRAVETVETVRGLSGSDRTVLHAFVMPNRGSFGTVASSSGAEPAYMQTEFDIMEERAVRYGHLIRGWKTYPAWGDVPYASGWFFDDPVIGQPFIEKVIELSQKYGLPPNIATHKGFALPAFDQRAASPRDIGPAARANPGANFIVYHSGYDGGGQDAYAGDANVNSADRSVDAFVKSLRENAWSSATPGATVEGFATEPGVRWANVKNVYAEIGSTWRTLMGSLGSGNWNGAGNAAAVHLLAKLINHIGPKRILWGTDSLWFGSPQSEIVGLRRVRASQNQALWDSYGLPHGIDGDANDPTQLASDPRNSIRNWIFGRAAAAVYGVDADAHLNDRAHLLTEGGAVQAGTAAIKCDDVQKIRDAYILNQMTPKESVPLASNAIIGARTGAELIKERRESPWAP
jgi:hypothetical protein